MNVIGNWEAGNLFPGSLPQSLALKVAVALRFKFVLSLSISSLCGKVTL